LPQAMKTWALREAASLYHPNCQAQRKNDGLATGSALLRDPLLSKHDIKQHKPSPMPFNASI
jgi:hypothetical protein